MRTTRKTLKFFRACSGLPFFRKMERIINHPLLLELPYLRIKPKTQTNKVKSGTLFKVWDPQKHTSSGDAYLPTLYMGLSPPPEDFKCHVASTHGSDLDNEYQVIHAFSVVKCCFCYLNIFEFKYMKWFTSFFGDMSQEVSCLSSKRFSLVMWLIKEDKFITEDMHVWPKKAA